MEDALHIYKSNVNMEVLRWNCYFTGSAGISVAESQNDTPAHVPHSVGSRGIHCFSADSGSDDEGNAVKPSNEVAMTLVWMLWNFQELNQRLC